MTFFEGMFGKVAPGMCRLSANGGVAVKTSSGYRTYDLKTGRLTNCDNFVFNIGEEFFFVVPTNKARVGDILLISGKPRCVIETAKDRITVINYEDSVVEQVLPEHHIFMGSTYFYGRIVSMFGKNAGLGKKGGGSILKYMMLSEMLKGTAPAGTKGGSVLTPGGTPAQAGMNPLLALMLLGGKGDGMFEDMFDLEDEDPDEDDGDDAGLPA